jgi:hypothetical protein
VNIHNYYLLLISTKLNVKTSRLIKELIILKTYGYFDHVEKNNKILI